MLDRNGFVKMCKAKVVSLEFEDKQCFIRDIGGSGRAKVERERFEMLTRTGLSLDSFKDADELDNAKLVGMITGCSNPGEIISGLRNTDNMIIAMSVCDEAGVPVFKVEDTNDMMVVDDIPSEFRSYLIVEIRKHSGLDEKAVEDSKKE